MAAPYLINERTLIFFANKKQTLYTGEDHAMINKLLEKNFTI